MTKEDYSYLSGLISLLIRKHPMIRAAASGQKLASEDDKGNPTLEVIPTRETLKTLEKSERMKNSGSAQVLLMNLAKARSGNKGGRPKKVKP